MPSENGGVSIGQLAPDFHLESVTREVVHLSDFRGQPIMLVFYRGSW